MQPWFTDAKLGIFLHWGIYAVRGVAESWSFYFGDVSYADYMAQAAGFTARRFDPDAWARLFRRSGARYSVLTAKHHDGMALWDTQAGDLSVAKRTPAARDLLGEYVAGMRRHDLKVGFYFSHLDWSHPDYPTQRPSTLVRPWVESRFGLCAEGAEDPARWERFLRFHRAQVGELLGYRPDLMWFDGAWERDESQWRMRELRDSILAEAPNMIVSRLLDHSDYETPEQGLPIVPPDGPWELCLTVNDSWGHQPADRNFKSTRQLVRIFAETLGGGGNLLLGIGPREDGTFQPEHVERLHALGAWIERNREAVYGTGRGLPLGHHYGPSMLSKDGRTLFLVCLDRPIEYVAVKGLRTKVRGVSVLGTGAALGHRVVGGFGDDVPGVLYIDAPAEVDEYATVLAVELDGVLDLYRGAGYHG
ncbi:alpha-L-fucosidase [Phytohabitans rumicis]|uniref:alpha-L-fucosidase n=1 Tax=Phytohabitans rumicis TaxID=1076125 RepID=UPI0031ED089E